MSEKYVPIEIDPNEKDIGITGVYKDADSFNESFQRFIDSDKADTKIYDRYTYPELKSREAEVSQALGLNPEDVLLYNSGMAAINESLFNSLKKGDVLLYGSNLYIQSNALIEEYKNKGVNCIKVDFGNSDELSEVIEKNNPAVIFGETVGNAPEGMSVLDVDKLVEKVTVQNRKYSESLSFSNIVEKNLLRNKTISVEGLDEQGRSNIIQTIEKTGKLIEEQHSYMPLRGLLRELEANKVLNLDHDRRRLLLELKSVIDTARAKHKEKPITLILDNTLPTEASLDLPEKIKDADFPFIVAESGTKFFAKDEASLGIIYGKDTSTMLNLRLQRSMTGTVLPPAVENMLPKISRESLEESKINAKNTKLLAGTLDRLVGNLGIKAVSHPNLPGHPNYDYALEHFPEGASPLLYLECDNAYETARNMQEVYQEAGLGDKINYSVSFGFDDTRLFFESKEDNILRIAAGKESEEEMEKLIEALINKKIN